MPRTLCSQPSPRYGIFVSALAHRQCRELDVTAAGFGEASWRRGGGGGGTFQRPGWGGVVGGGWQAVEAGGKDPNCSLQQGDLGVTGSYRESEGNGMCSRRNVGIEDFKSIELFCFEEY